MVKSFILQSSVALGVSFCVLAPAQNADKLPVGTIVNFGPDLQTIAGGVCRQPEGSALDLEENLYLASNSDAATQLVMVGRCAG